MALVSSALISATRQWIDHLEQPPSEIARRRWEQANGRGRRRRRRLA
jgi:hypothetical protein